LIKQLLALKYTDGTSMTDHLKNFQGIMNQLSAMGIKFDEEIQGLLLLGSLPDSWEILRTSLSNSAPDGLISMDLAKSSVLNEEMKRKSLGTSPNSDILVFDYRGRSNSHAPNDTDQSGSNSKGRYKDVECNYCHKKRHIKKYCWKLKNKSEKDDKGKDSSDDEDRINATFVEFLLVHEFEFANLVDSLTSWVIDSSASFHITSRKDLFISYTPGDFASVKMAHEGVVIGIGVGQVCLEMSNGSRLILKHVNHAPDVWLNLLSVGKLCDENYNSSFLGDSWKLTKGSMIVGKGTKHSTLYITQAKIVKDVDHATDFIDGTDLWHKKLCHMSEKGKSVLVRKNVLSDVGKAHLQKSSHCFVGKKNKVSFKSHLPLRKSEIGDLDHSDDNNVDMMTKTLPRKTINMLLYCRICKGLNLVDSPCEVQTHYVLVCL